MLVALLMLAEKLIVKVMDGNKVKLGIENVDYGDGENVMKTSI